MTHALRRGRLAPFLSPLASIALLGILLAPLAVLMASAAPALADPPKTTPAPVKSAAPKPLSQSLTGQAKADFEAAKLLANDGDFASALIKFQSAYDAARDVRLLWNVAFCQKNLRRYAKVVATLKRYIDEGAATLTAADKKDAQDLIATIEPFTTRATIAVNEPGAQVSVDDEPVGTSPLPGPVVLDLGERHLRVIKEGFRPYEKAVPVGGAADVTIDVALEREVHEGKIAVEAAAGAAIFVDGTQVGVGKVEVTVPSGGHQLRVTAPQMRPYQTEVVIQDKETRSVSVALEAEAPPVKPTLRVAVGCGDTSPKAPDEGLVVHIDGPDELPPTLVKQRWSSEESENVLDYVAYSINPGPHTIRVAITGCYGYDVRVDVDPVKGADISGALETKRGVLFQGPQGSPGWFQASLGLWLAGGNVKDSVPDHYASRGISVVGEAVEMGIVDRWFDFYLGGSYGTGSFNRTSFNSTMSLPDSAGVKWERFAMRFGPRFPFNVVSLGFGPKIGWEDIDVAQVRTGQGTGYGGGYFEVAFEPLCDWGTFLDVSVDKPFNNDDASGSAQFGFIWAPSPTCHKERDTDFGLRPQAR
jgi:hypothetical protein